MHKIEFNIFFSTIYTILVFLFDKFFVIKYTFEQKKFNKMQKLRYTNEKFFFIFFFGEI